MRWAPYIGVESVGGSSQALRLGVTLTSGRRFDAGIELGRRQGGPGAGSGARRTDSRHAALVGRDWRWTVGSGTVAARGNTPGQGETA